MSSITVSQALALAQQHQQAGRLAEAEALYRRILAAEPRHIDALHLLGLVAHQAGRHAEAAHLIQQAIAACPSHPALHSNLGEVHRAMGNLDAAIASLRRAAELDPTYAKAHANLGNALRQQGRLEEAVASYQRALESKPDSPEVCNHLGNALGEQGRLDEAIAAYRRALELKPDYAEATYNLASMLEKQGRNDEAVAAYRQAVELRPDFAEAHANLGMALSAQGRLAEAIASFQRALELKPDYAAVCRGLGVALLALNRVDEAIAWFERAVQLRPECADSRNNLGAALMAQGRAVDAIAVFREALDRAPGHVDSRHNLATALMSEGRLIEAIAELEELLRLAPEHATAWSNLANSLASQGRLDEAGAAYRKFREVAGRKPDWPWAWSNRLFFMHYRPELGSADFLREHQCWAEIHERPLAHLIEPCANDPDPDRRLRVGYVSPDFRAHSVASFIEGLFAQHDPAQVEVFAYSANQWKDEVTGRLRRHASQWREIYAMSDAQAAELIRNDRIDILVDLSGHTGDNRLLIFARKPAPVQVTWLGYCDTTGLGAMDYRITDAHADPPGVMDEFHTERLVRLPECAWCFSPGEDAPPVAPLPALRSGVVTFGSFNALPKINDEVLAFWAELLRRAPGSRLLLKAVALIEPPTRKRILERLESFGVARERVRFSGALPSRSAHLDAYRRVDVGLDPFPYNGTTTTCEALWMGVPVVTLAGAHHAARVGVSLLHAAGLEEFIARDRSEYLEIALRLSRDLSRLAELRATLRERLKASPLLDAPGFARRMEAAYREMWRAWCGEQARR